MLDDHPVDTRVGQRLQLVAQAGDTGRRLGKVACALGKVFPRMRLEGHDRGRKAVRGAAQLRASRAWWPRCTPSKLPIVSAQGAHSSDRGNPRTLIRIFAL